MSRPDLLKIHPEQVKWKYFYLDQEDGEIKHCTQAEEIPAFTRKDGSIVERNKVAVLTTSLCFIEKPKDQTPNKMQSIVETALNYKGRPSEFCIALPYIDGHEQYYGIREKTPYSDIVVHNNFNPHSGIGYMSPKAGAAQIASAIENGFHIHCMAGGVQIEPKLELVRDYFRVKPLPENHKRRIIAGFSDGSENQFGLREIVEYIHAGNAGKTFSTTWPTAPEKVQEMIEIFEEKKDHPLQRVLNCENSATYNQIKSRYQEGDQVRLHTYFPRQLLSAIDSPYRPDFAGEKLILGLEGYLQSETGYNASEVLETALQSGVIKPEQLIAVVVENIVVQEDEMSVRRIDGYIPEYEMLTRSEKDKILGILCKRNNLPKISVDKEEDLIGGYIIRANSAYNNEVARIKEVAERYGIPTILGGEVRAGHAKNFIIQPNYISGIEFDDRSQAIVVNSLIRNNAEVAEIPKKNLPHTITPKVWYEKSFVIPLSCEDSVVYLGEKVKENYPYSKRVTAPVTQSEDLNHKFSELRIMAMNEAGQAFLENEENLEFDIIAGTAGNISERRLEELNGKGLLCILPHRVEGKGVHQSFDHPKLHNSGRFGASDIIEPIDDYQIPFVILAAQDSHIHNERTLRPILRDLNPQVPVLVTTNLSQEFLQDLPALFEARINIQEMQHPLRKLDNQRLPACKHQGQELSVHIITSKNSAKNSPKALELLGPIAWETQRRLIEDLLKKKDATTVPSEMDTSWLETEMKKRSSLDPEEFGNTNKTNDYTAMILEDKDGNPLSAMSFTINDEKTKMLIDEEGRKATSIFFDLSQTVPEYSGQGFLKLMRGFLLPQILEQSGFSGKAYYSNSMKRMKVTNPLTKELVYENMPNFRTHGKIFDFINPQQTIIFERWRNIGQTQDFSREGDHGTPLSDFLNNGVLNQKALQTWMEQAKKQHPEKKLEGCFMCTRVDDLSELVQRSSKTLLTADGQTITKTPGQMPSANSGYSVVNTQNLHGRSDH
ncbi:MAG: hypothetical protein V4694_00375 [Pseudomonadota bacterium]